MNCVLATENEKKLREEFKRWVHQALSAQSDLDEAKEIQSELEKNNNSLNIKVIQVRKNKRLLRNIVDLHEGRKLKTYALQI